MNRLITIATPIMGLLLLAAGGCNGNKIDCAQVCAAYADCIDSDLDIPECTLECEGDADSSQVREDRLESCESCIEGLSCTEQTLQCTDECAFVIEPN